jgi:integrase/recombinase XerD
MPRHRSRRRRCAARFIEFFAATIRNKNTRMAYHRAVCHFFAWAEQHEIGELAGIEPVHVAAYIEVLQTTAAKPTVKLHLAAIRMLLDWLVVGQVLAVNPAHAVRGPKHVVRRGKTRCSPRSKLAACSKASTRRRSSAGAIAR